MMSETTSNIRETTRPVRRITFVGGCSEQLLADTVLEAVDHHVVFLEPAAQAYSHIKRTAPDLVIVCLTSDGIDGCQVLSMLALDRDTSHIPVLTFLTPDCRTTRTCTSIECSPDTCCRAALYQ